MYISDVWADTRLSIVWADVEPYIKHVNDHVLLQAHSPGHYVMWCVQSCEVKKRKKSQYLTVDSFI